MATPIDYEDWKKRNALQPGQFIAFGTRRDNPAAGPARPNPVVASPVISNLPYAQTMETISASGAGGVGIAVQNAPSPQPAQEGAAPAAAGPLPYAPGFARPAFDTGARFTPAQRAEQDRVARIRMTPTSTTQRQAMIEQPGRDAYQLERDKAIMEGRNARYDTAAQARRDVEQIRTGGRIEDRRMREEAATAREIAKLTNLREIQGMRSADFRAQIEANRDMLRQRLAVMVGEGALDRASEERMTAADNATRQALSRDDINARMSAAALTAKRMQLLQAYGDRVSQFNSDEGYRLRGEELIRTLEGELDKMIAGFAPQPKPAQPQGVEPPGPAPAAATPQPPVEQPPVEQSPNPFSPSNILAGGKGQGSDFNQNGVRDAEEGVDARDEMAAVWAKQNAQNQPIKAKAIMQDLKRKYPKVYGGA